MYLIDKNELFIHWFNQIKIRGLICQNKKESKIVRYKIEMELTK